MAQHLARVERSCRGSVGVPCTVVKSDGRSTCRPLMTPCWRNAPGEDAAPLPVPPGRTVVATRRQGTVTLRLEYVRCGKASCHCAQDAGHGPYWYAYSRKAGRVTSAYLGKDAGKFMLGSP
jgi:hypothetical protein